MRASAGDPHAALALLEELFRRNPEFPVLAVAMERHIGPLLREAVDSSKYRRARWLIRRLSRRFPDSQIVHTTARALGDQAEQVIGQLGKGTAEAIESLDKAAVTGQLGKPRKEMIARVVVDGA